MPAFFYFAVLLNSLRG